MSGMRLDRATAERMGYEGVVAAETIAADNTLVELCLIAPSHAEGRYSMAIHWDCDQKQPTVGTSSMEEVGYTEQEAEAVFSAKVNEIRAELGLPTYHTGPR